MGVAKRAQDTARLALSATPMRITAGASVLRDWQPPPAETGVFEYAVPPADTRGGALKEGGDLVQPLAGGVIAEQDIIADLSELTRGLKQGRGSAHEITLFKSVGSAIEDLAAAELVVERA